MLFLNPFEYEATLHLNSQLGEPRDWQERHALADDQQQDEESIKAASAIAQRDRLPAFRRLWLTT